MEIDAFILVGGRSSRFGSDKAIVEFGGETLIERTAATFRRGVGSNTIKLVAADDTRRQPSWTVPVILDLHPDRGPLGAIHTALAHARTEWAFIAACDFPCLTSDLLRHLSDAISDDLDAVAPIQPDGRIQPLCAFYRVKPCLKVVERLLVGTMSAPPAMAIFENVRTRLVRFDEIGHLPGSKNFFLNMNTPADLQKAMSIVDARSAFVAK